jgi:hypothetical protein
MKRALYGTPKQRNALRTSEVGTGFIMLRTDNMSLLEAEVYVDRAGVLRRIDTGEPFFPLTLREVLPGKQEAIIIEVAPQVQEEMADQQPARTQLSQATDENQATDHHSQDPEVRAGRIALDRVSQLFQSLYPSARQILLHGDGDDPWVVDRADHTIHIMIEQLYTVLRALGVRENLDMYDRVD